MSKSAVISRSPAKRVDNISASMEKFGHSDVAVVRFSIDGHKRYIKAPHSSTTPAELEREVRSHLDYWNRIDSSNLDNYGEVA